MILSILPLPVFASKYLVTPLVSDKASIAAPNTDPHLINPWGLFFVPNGHGVFWVADNGSNLSTLYNPDGTIIPSVINVLSNPTGASANPTATHFNITKGSLTAPASFIFATESGTILGFKKSLDPANAIIAVDNSATGAVYKGLDFGEICCQYNLFLTDFHNAKIDMFNGNFDLTLMIKDFTLPSGYAPFNIKFMNNLFYVTYAKQLPPLNHDDDPGPGHGFVNVFDNTGTLITHLISQGHLNSPWGLALAPSTFGQFSGALIVGNFGDGKINAYNPHTGAFLGQLNDASGNAIIIDGLWSLEFNSHGILYFTSGPNGESDGLAGTITLL